MMHQGRIYPAWRIWVAELAIAVIIMSVVVAFCNRDHEEPKRKKTDHNVVDRETKSRSTREPIQK